MKEFLRSIKLIDEFTIKLDCPKAYFIRALEQNIDTSGFEFFESWSSGPPFKGSLSGDTFSIRQRRKVFTTNMRMTVKLNGTVQSNTGKSVVVVEANGVNMALSSSLIFLGFFFSFWIYVSIDSGTSVSFFLIPFTFQVVLILGVVYFALRKTVSLARRETEKEFLWMIRNYVPGSD